MKTFKQFREDNQYVSEGIGALITPALKLGGKALAAYSAYSAGGKVFKGIKALGGAKNLAKAGSAAQSTVRLNLTGKTPNAFAKGVDTVFDKGQPAISEIRR